jgi:hypothetical protein
MDLSSDRPFYVHTKSSSQLEYKYGDKENEKEGNSQVRETFPRQSIISDEFCSENQRDA